MAAMRPDHSLHDVWRTPWFDTCGKAFPVTGRFRLGVFRDGDLVELVDEPNLVVVGARQVLAALLTGSALQPGVSQIGYGSSIAAPAFGNTALTNAFLRPIDGAASPVPGVAVFRFSLGGPDANGLSIAEFGLLSPGGVLFARKTRRSAPILKDVSVSLSGTWTINF